MMFAEMTIAAAGAIGRLIQSKDRAGWYVSCRRDFSPSRWRGMVVLDQVDVVAIHGSRWTGTTGIHDWPQKVEEIRRVADRPVWVSEAGASCSAQKEVQVFGMNERGVVTAGC